MKIMCKDCRKTKSTDNFYYNNRDNRHYYSCKECFNKKTKKNNKNFQIKAREELNDWYIKKLISTQNMKNYISTKLLKNEHELIELKRLEVQLKREIKKWNSIKNT
jgi:hypothetical protein